jgi:hypothetical protein
MYKIALTGKANSGKNTVSKLIYEELSNTVFAAQTHTSNGWNYQTTNFNGMEFIAFADPIKEMIRLMFPQIKYNFLYGPSKYRAEYVPGAFKDGKPVTIRELLQDLGTGVGRGYKETIWLDAFDHTFAKAQKKNKSLVIVTDVRFRNEFDHLKKLGFYQIRLLRDSHLHSTHISETNQDTIKDSEYDYVLHNNGTLENLKEEVSKIVSKL